MQRVLTSFGDVVILIECAFLRPFLKISKENQNFFEKSIAFSGKSWYYIRVVTTQQNMDG